MKTDNNGSTFEQAAAAAKAGKGPDGHSARTADDVLAMAKAATTLDEKAAAMAAWRALGQDARALTCKAVAKTLGVTVADLRGAKGRENEPDEMVKGHDPHPSPVDGIEMADDIEAMFSRHIYLPPHGATALTLWAITSHGVRLDAFETAPYLNLASPVRRCGKSTTLDLLESVVAYPVACSGASAATLFRMIDAARPTVLIDEADKVFARAKDNPDLVAAINAGHRRGAGILRCVGDDNTVKRFGCFTSYALAGIGTLPDTIADRSIPVPLSRKPPGVKLTRRGANWRAEGWAKGERAARWVADNAGPLATLAHEAPRPAFLDDRAADSWAPLFAVAKALGGDWPQKAWDAARALSGGRDDVDDSAAAHVLRDCRAAFATDWAGNTKDPPHDRLPTSELLRVLKGIPEAPWSGWNRGRGLDDRGLARLLKPYGVRAKTIRSGTETPRGYERAGFVSAWDAYCGSADGLTDGDADEWAQWAVGPSETSTHEEPPYSGGNGATTAQNTGNPCCGEVGDEAASATAKPLDSSNCCTVAECEGETAEQDADDEDHGITI